MSLSAHVRLWRGDFELDASLEAEAGVTTALLGPNGSGKTTLVRALAGLVPLQEGEVIVNGEVWERPSAGIRLSPQQRSVGMMSQKLSLFPSMSALDNVAYGLRAAGLRAREARSRSQALLEHFGIDHLAHRRPLELSGGEAQRVALARALAPRPMLLLLDEPLSALDVENRREVRRALAQAMEEFDGVGLLVTHDPVLAIFLAQALVVMEAGRVVQSGSANEIRAAPRSPYAAAFAGVNRPSPRP